MVEALIEAGANVNHEDAEGRMSLMVAASCGHIDIVRALLAAGADPRIAVTVAGSLNGKTALNAAKAGKHTAIIALLEAKLVEFSVIGLMSNTQL